MGTEQARDQAFDELDETARQIKEMLTVVARSDPERAAAWLKGHKARLKAILEAAKPE